MSYRKATLPPVEACAVCKRRPSMGHALDCTGGPTPPTLTVPGRPASLAEWAKHENIRRQAAAQEEKAVMASSIKEALTNAGITTLQAPADETKICATCGVPKSLNDFDKVGRYGRYPHCKTCRRARATHATSDGLVLEVAAVVEAPIDIVPEGAVWDHASGAWVSAPIVDDAGGTDWTPDPAPVLTAPSPSSGPNGGDHRSLAQLRAERGRPPLPRPAPGRTGTGSRVPGQARRGDRAGRGDRAPGCAQPGRAARPARGGAPSGPADRTGVAGEGGLA